MQEFNNHRDWKCGWPYRHDAPFDPQWLFDRSETFALHGNGWWWGWNETTCPIEELKGHFNNLKQKEKQEESV